MNALLCVPDASMLGRNEVRIVSSLAWASSGLPKEEDGHRLASEMHVFCCILQISQS